jgi:conjugal transfer mating pair stabilization protein TraN
MKSIITITLIISWLTNSVFANDYKTDIFEAINSVKNNPTEYLADYSENPSEININKDNMDALARQKAAVDENAIALKNNFNKRPEYKFDESMLAKDGKIIANANDIARGIANSYTDCKTVKNCTIKYSDTINYCNAASKQQNLSCDKDRVVSVVYPKIINKKIRVEMKATNDEAAYTFDIKTKTLISGTTSVSYYSQSVDYDFMSCSNFTSRELSKGLLPGTHSRKVTWNISFNNDCNNPSVYFYFDQKDSKKYGYREKGGYIEIEVSSQEPPITSDGFESTCLEVNNWLNTGYCREIKTSCVIGASTKTINGLEVTRDCWRYRSDYICGSKGNNKVVAACDSLEKNGCMQINSKCTEYLGDKCIAQEKGFKCPINTCGDDSNIVCGGTHIQCQDGSCVESVNKEPADFNTAATKFAVLGQALTGAPSNYTEDTKFMFAGKAMECRKDGYGFSDCCKDKGWGQDMGLAHCSDAEKELGEMKEKLFTVYLGEKSHKNDIGIKKTDKVYCVFNSKLAKIIQEQGRSWQLEISLGSAKNPSCSAISPKDLANINFDKIDLASAFDEVNTKQKAINQGDTTKDLAAKIGKYYTDGVGDHA